jgi:hypothetical protein
MYAEGIVGVSVQLPVSIFTVDDRGLMYSLRNYSTVNHSPDTTNTSKYFYFYSRSKIC